jgi:hypothetical protein
MTATADTLVCSNCNFPLSTESWASGAAVACPACRARTTVLTFPALVRKLDAPDAGQPVLEEGEASCFQHPAKRAVAPCDQCGRFLCGLCRVEFMGQIWCPACIDNHRQSGALAKLDSSRPLYDNMALALAIFPMLLIWPTIVTAPMSVYVALRYWRAQTSVLPRTKSRFIAALLLSSAQIGAWLWLVAYLIYRAR